MLVWVLLSRHWWLLPAIGILGVLAKETFLPLAASLALVWWWFDLRHRNDRRLSLILIGAMFAAAAIVIFVARWTSSGATSASLALHRNPGGGFFSGLTSAIFSHTFWYVFVWLLPLGVGGLKRLPRPWVLGSLFAALMALALGVFRNIEGNVARPLFAAIGPALCLGAAFFLVGQAESPSKINRY